MHDAFQRAAHRIIVGAENGMENFAAAVMYDSLLECPVDTGTLRRSARINHTTSDGISLHTEFGYGYGDGINPKTIRPAAEYVVPVHERVEVRHQAPTKAKFLEDPLLLHAKELGPRMVAKMREALLFKNVTYEYFSETTAGMFPIISRMGSGQPIVRTPHGPRFGRKHNR